MSSELMNQLSTIAITISIANAYFTETRGSGSRGTSSGGVVLSVYTLLGYRHWCSVPPDSGISIWALSIFS